MKRLESVASPIHKTTTQTATITVTLPWIGLQNTGRTMVLEITHPGDEEFVPIVYPVQTSSPSGAVFWLDSNYWELPRGMYEGKVIVDGNEICRFVLEHRPRVIEKENVPSGVLPSDASRVFVRFPFSG